MVSHRSLEIKTQICDYERKTDSGNSDPCAGIFSANLGYTLVPIGYFAGQYLLFDELTLSLGATRRSIALGGKHNLRAYSTQALVAHRSDGFAVANCIDRDGKFLWGICLTGNRLVVVDPRSFEFLPAVFQIGQNRIR